MSESKFSIDEIVRVKWPAEERILRSIFDKVYYRVNVVFMGHKQYSLSTVDKRTIRLSAIDEEWLEKITEFEQIMLNIEQGTLNDK